MEQANNPPRHFAICILCALAEEARSFMATATDLGVSEFRPAFSSEHLQYYHGTITTRRGEQLSIQVSWQTGYGPLEAGLHMQRMLGEFKPIFAAMTGICAGDRDSVALGDIIVAEKAFSIDTGKVIQHKRGQRQQYDTETYLPPPAILHFVRGFDGWQARVACIERPISRRQQRDWLLTTLLAETSPSIDMIGIPRLDRYAPDWRKIVHMLQQEPDAYLTRARTLQDAASISDLLYGPDIFPYTDPDTPRVHIVPMASSSAVRADRPFETIRVPVRHTVALDMEGASFYRTAANFPDTLFLLVKGVADYAEGEKDDSYRAYASAVSAAYVLSLIHEYITLAHPHSTQPVEEAATPYAAKASEGIINLFSVYAPEDEELIRQIDIHLKILQRLGYIAELYGEHRFDVGMDEEQEMQHYLAQSTIILLLISPDFFASELCNRQMKQAIRMQHAGKARIVPILLRPTYLDGTSVHTLRMLPRNGRAITAWGELDTAFSEIAREIRAIADQCREQQ
jgi:nucleoside phosphorylase